MEAGRGEGFCFLRRLQGIQYIVTRTSHLNRFPVCPSVCTLCKGGTATRQKGGDSWLAPPHKGDLAAAGHEVGQSSVSSPSSLQAHPWCRCSSQLIVTEVCPHLPEASLQGWPGVGLAPLEGVGPQVTRPGQTLPIGREPRREGGLVGFSHWLLCP